MSRDLDAWRRVCLEAYRNLPTDTEVTMSQVDAVLSVGARETAVVDTSTAEGAADYECLLDRVGQATGVEREDVDAVLTWCARDAAALLEQPREDQERDDGKWSAFEVAVMVARQNGKGAAEVYSDRPGYQEAQRPSYPPSSSPSTPQP